MGKIYAVGIGQGGDTLTFQAKAALDKSDMIVGYTKYVSMVKEEYPEKEFFENGMKGEVERCEKCIEAAVNGKTVSLICSGDAGVYGMASLLLTIAEKRDFKDIEVIPGVTAATGGAAVLGAPLSHDFCVISLSDLLTPWEVIEKRLACAAEGDFCIALYNPASHGRKDHLKKACDILMEKISGETASGYVRDIGKSGCEKKLCSLKELSGEEVGMDVTVFIGNSQTKIAGERLITPRGYLL